MSTFLDQHITFVSIVFCMFCAFVLYELSGLIGKGMLVDKHITGKGKGYCDITFGRENQKSLIINIQYNIFAPIIYMLIIAAIVQRLNAAWLLEKVVYIVPCYYLVRGFMITVISGKRQLYNFRYELMMAAAGCIFAAIVHYALILSNKPIMPTVEEFRTQLWLVFFALAYNFAIRTFGRSPKIKQNNICTSRMKKNYILDKYDTLKKKYGNIVCDIASGNYLQQVIYAIMIYENFNRTATQRWCENILFRLGKRPMTLGIMQVKTNDYITNAKSVELGSKKIKNSFDEFVETAVADNPYGYWFGLGEQESCLNKICQDYNGAQDYCDAIKYIFYTLPAPENGYDETDEIYNRYSWKEYVEDENAETDESIESREVQEVSENGIGEAERKNTGEDAKRLRFTDCEDVYLELDDLDVNGDLELEFKNCKNVRIERHNQKYMEKK